MTAGINDFDRKTIEKSMKTGGESAINAFNLCTEYSKLGNRDAMGYLARMYRDGIGTEKNMDMAIYWMKCAYDKKLSYARFELSLLLADRSKQDGSLAFELCKAEVNKKNPKAYSHMAHLYSQGIGCEANEDLAIDCLQEAYDNGFDWAGLQLVKMLIKRKNSGDLGKAFSICSELSNNGNIRASGLLGQMYRDGIGCAPDKDMAIEKLKIAAPEYEWAHKDLVDLISQ